MSQPVNRPCSERLSNLEWESHIKSWEESSLSKAEYCRQENISYYAFNYWQRRLKPPGQFSPITMVKLEEIQSVPPSFEPQSTPSESPIRFWVKSFCIEVGNNFSPAVLSRLVETLRRL